MGSSSLGIELVAGKKRVPNPATGNTAFLVFASLFPSTFTLVFISVVTVLYIIQHKSSAVVDLKTNKEIYAIQKHFSK